jgi:hypothetical protein
VYFFYKLGGGGCGSEGEPARQRVNLGPVGCLSGVSGLCTISVTYQKKSIALKFSFLMILNVF